MLQKLIDLYFEFCILLVFSGLRLPDISFPLHDVLVLKWLLPLKETNAHCITISTFEYIKEFLKISWTQMKDANAFKTINACITRRNTS